MVVDQPYGSVTSWLGLLFIVLMGAYFYCYSQLIERIRTNHAVLWTALGKPTPMDSNISSGFLRMSGFILHFKFLQVPDRIVKVLGLVVVVLNVALLLFFPVVALFN
jgi:hypothetical protein